MYTHEHDTPLQLRTLLLPLLLLLVPHHAPENLAAGTLRHHIDELNPTSQPLVIALVFLDMLRDISLENLIGVFDRAGSFDDKGFGHLAFAVGRNADDDAVVHAWVGEEVGFEFGWSDLHAFDFD